MLVEFCLELIESFEKRRVVIGLVVVVLSLVFVEIVVELPDFLGYLLMVFGRFLLRFLKFGHAGKDHLFEIFQLFL
jgi:hypothetical protein